MLSECNPLQQELLSRPRLLPNYYKFVADADFSGLQKLQIPDWKNDQSFRSERLIFVNQQQITNKLHEKTMWLVAIDKCMNIGELIIN